ncbi:hypothetical protein EKL30_03515 [Candidimonas sp. SYP-B2681]|nr:hypothetical protein EKL30_03515 [Candidimonas sp. SYP-B2681]
MARPKIKTTVTTVKLTPRMRELWAAVAQDQNRSLTNTLETLLLDYAKRHNIVAPSEAVASEEA